ncbi:EamA family transporter [Pokkaliibacter plantistimulans]|uniref:EamA family transporter n=1 Tax=Proteobacteria bacterium 228 TaxID=2083153 RepID=A0A2S5KM10_9PROT|nr:DMT family transporter [Pokkaliibacter plantistimulans]PPC75569.1 EamA family transporter [Pokkaliibacter plantistimulans]
MHRLAYFAYALLGLIWGTNFIFTKWAGEVISPAQIVMLRVLFGFVPILAYALYRRELHWAHLRHSHHFLVMALLATVLYYLAFAKGTVLLLSSVAGMLSGAIPLFSFLTAMLFLRQEPINARTVLGMLCGFAGVVLIARPWSSLGGDINLQGVLYMILGSLSLGASFVYARKYITPLQLSPVALCTYQIGIGSVLVLLTTDTSGIAAFTASPRALWGMVLGLGLIGTGVAYILYYFIVAQLGAVKAAGVTYIPPLVALAIGYFWVGEPLATTDLFAVVLIMGGVYVLQSGKKGSASNRITATSTLAKQS